MIDEPNTVVLWRFPPSEFAAWVEHCCGGASPLADYAGYLAAIDDAAAHAMARGLAVKFVAWPVAEMLARLAAAGVDNTSANRAAALAADVSTLGLKIAHNAIGWGLVAGDAAEADRAERPVAAGESVADALAAEIDARLPPGEPPPFGE